MNQLVRLRKTHPQRPLEWRWERARAATRLKRQLPIDFLSADDEWTKCCFKLQKRLSKQKDNEAHIFRALEAAGPVGIAYELWDSDGEQAGRFVGFSRYELEARILARQPFSEIADVMATTAEVVIAYEAVFFNVLDRLENDGWIRQFALGGVMTRGMSDKDIGTIVKAYAYYTGSVDLINCLISTFDSMDTVGVSAGNILSFLDRDSRFSLMRKTALAGRMLPLNSYTQERLLDFTTQRAKAKMSADDSSEIVSGEDPLKALLKEIVWRTGPSQSCQRLIVSDEPRAGELIERPDAVLDNIDFPFPS